MFVLIHRTQLKLREFGRPRSNNSETLLKLFQWGNGGSRACIQLRANQCEKIFKSQSNENLPRIGGRPEKLHLLLPLPARKICLMTEYL